MAAPTVGPGVSADFSGTTSTTINLTVTANGSGVVVGVTCIDTAVFVATSVTGIPGVTFLKIAEGAVISEAGYPNYQGAPSLWLAKDVPAGTYAITVTYAGASGCYGTAVAQQIGPTAASITTTVNNGNSATPDTGAIPVQADSLTFALVAFSPNNTIGFAAPASGWVRQGVQNDNANFTGLVLDSNQQTSAGTISETFPNTQNAASPWSVITASLVSPSAGTARRCLVMVGGVMTELPAGDTVEGTGVSAHSGMSGLANDDHLQYHTDAEGDLRYAALTHGHPLSTITQGGALGAQALTWNGSSWAPAFQPSNGRALQAVQSADQAITTTTLTNAANLVIGLEANAVYAIECEVTFQMSVTTSGLALAISTPSGCRNMVEMTVPISTAVTNNQLRTIFPNAAAALNAGSVTGTGVTAANSNHTARISGILRNGANAGDCQIQFAASGASATVTLKADSVLNLWRLA